MRDLNTLLTSEMTQEEWSAFRKSWIEEEADALVVECDVDPAEAKELSSIRFEQYVGQEGYTGRDERIAEARYQVHSSS